MRRKTIITTNPVIYKKINLLQIDNEVVFNKNNSLQINKIINNINKKEKIIDIMQYDDFIILKRLKPFNFNLYLQSSSKI